MNKHSLALLSCLAIALPSTYTYTLPSGITNFLDNLLIVAGAQLGKQMTNNLWYNHTIGTNLDDIAVDSLKATTALSLGEYIGNRTFAGAAWGGICATAVYRMIRTLITINNHTYLVPPSTTQIMARLANAGIWSGLEAAGYILIKHLMTPKINTFIKGLV